jgi:hypothetical protein
MEERVRAGGRPLFLIQWGDTFYIVPGACAIVLRVDPRRENIKKHATTIWKNELPMFEFLTVLRNPENEYTKGLE